MMHPMFVGGTARFERALVNCSEPFRDTFRCVVVGPNETRSTRQRKVLEQPITSRPRCFGREAFFEGMDQLVSMAGISPSIAGTISPKSIKAGQASAVPVLASVAG